MIPEDEASTELAPRLDALIDADLFVPVRSSSGTAPDPERVDADAFRHGTDESGERFIRRLSTNTAHRAAIEC